MRKEFYTYKTGVLIYIINALLFFSLQNVIAQNKVVGGIITIGEINSPGVGGISIKVKGTSNQVVSDNDGEYKISVLNDNAILVFSYPGMISQKIVVGNRSRIDVDLIAISPENVATVYATNITIVLNENSNTFEKNVAQVLKDRLQTNSKVEVTISHESDLNSSINIYLGLANNSVELNDLSLKHNLRLPGYKKLAAEGFSVKMINEDNKPVLLAVGNDNRGLLYAVGEILRQTKMESLGVKIDPMDVSTAPAYRFRGANASQGHSMRKFTGSRAWTFDEWKQVTLDYALAGANCFSAEWNGGEKYDFIKSFDLLTIVGIRPNSISGEFPETWKSSGLSDWEWLGGSNWVCPNIPEAREALLQQWTDRFKTWAKHDILRFYAGDPGGCRDERCKPWGKSFTLLSEDISKVALKSQPEIKVLIANQDLTNEGDQAIFDYLADKPQNWLYGLAYGPGSNAMSWYFRHKLNEDMFEYPGFGWLNRYLAETLNALPKEQKIVHYSDITHWTMAQYNIMNPERNIAKSYGRRTWHTRPHALFNIFQAIMPFSQGDIIYTEGYHDHFNQYLWQRLLWNPHFTSVEVVQEYAKIYFGEKAAELMKEAIFQLEKNMEIPLANNDGIDRYYFLVKEAGKYIPKNILENNHIWRLHMQKASLDKYNQLKLQHELYTEKRIRKLLQEGIETGNLNLAIDESLIILKEPKENSTMLIYREEADKLGVETGELFGIRNIGFSKLDQHLRDINGLSLKLNKARKVKSNKEKIELMTLSVQNTYKKTDYGEVHW